MEAFFLLFRYTDVTVHGSRTTRRTTFSATPDSSDHYRNLLFFDSWLNSEISIFRHSIARASLLRLQRYIRVLFIFPDDMSALLSCSRYCSMIGSAFVKWCHYAPFPAYDRYTRDPRVEGVRQIQIFTSKFPSVFRPDPAGRHGSFSPSYCAMMRKSYESSHPCAVSIGKWGDNLLLYLWNISQVLDPLLSSLLSRGGGNHKQIRASTGPFRITLLHATQCCGI